MTATGLDYWDIAKRAIDISGIACWGRQESYLGDIARSINKYRKQPVWVSFGWGGLSRRAIYSMLAHGNPKLYWPYHYGPLHVSTECAFSHDLPRLAEIRKISHEIGAVEDILYQGHLRKPEVALLFSQTSESWNFDKKLIFERILIHKALCHSHIPVDIITENDIIDGYLNKYKVLYLPATNILKKSAGKIEEWVRNGGVLFATASGGLRDEFNQPSKVLKMVYGIKDSKTVFYGSGKKGSLFLLPISERVLGCKRINISVYDYQETFVLGKGKIVGVYDNNTIGAL